MRGICPLLCAAFACAGAGTVAAAQGAGTTGIMPRSAVSPSSKSTSRGSVDSGPPSWWPKSITLRVTREWTVEGGAATANSPSIHTVTLQWDGRKMWNRMTPHERRSKFKDLKSLEAYLMKAVGED